MDAAVMSGKEFGSVICIENVKNPVLVAREMGYGYYNPATERSMAYAYREFQ